MHACRQRHCVRPLEDRAVPAVFVVTTTGDSGPGSLRDALTQLSLSSDATNTVDATAVSGTITLASPLPNVSKSASLVGPDASKLTLDADLKCRHLNVDGPGAVAVSVSGITFVNGVADGDGYGGAIRLNPEQESLTVSDCVFRDNASSAGGGAIGQPPNALDGVHASLVVTGCLFENNTAGGQGGGALHMNTFSPNNPAGPQLKVMNSAFRNNVATAFYGGAIFMRMGSNGIPASLFVDACEFTANINETGYGGAIGLRTGLLASTSVTLRNSTFFGNLAASTGPSAGGGSALALSAINGSVTVQNCTLTKNVSCGVDPVLHPGGAISVTSGAPTVTVEGSIIFDNPSADSPGVQIRGGAGQFTFINTCLGSKVGIANYVDGGGNLPIGTDPLLAPLADNGGQSRTCALLPGSPAIDKGSNPAALATDQRGAGFARVAGAVADMGAFEVQVARVGTVAVNDGSPQRSRVTSLRAMFDLPVTLPANPADAFLLKRQWDNAAVGLAAAVAGNAVTLTFTGGPLDFGSLADGRYTLTVSAAQVNGGNFDGDGDGTPGDDFVLVGTPTNGLFRLFGDADGDGDVDAVDFSAFRAAFGGSGATFDFDGDGDIDAADFGAVRQRFGAGV